MINIKSETEWQQQIRILKCVKADDNRQGPADSPIWYETKNFGWILSAKNEDGKRQILARF